MKLTEILYNLNNEHLQKLTKFVDGCKKAKRKDHLVNCLYEAMMTPDSRTKLWAKLDDLSKKAVASAYHNDGQFIPDAFVAQYGRLPDRPRSRWFWQLEFIPVDLFIHNNELPEDLLPLLADLVPPPDRFQLEGRLDTPPTVENQYGQVVPLTQVDSEETGLHDMIALLHLIDQGQIKASYSTGRLTAAKLKKVTANLLADDFFPAPEKAKPEHFIRAFGLHTFATQAGLAGGSYLTEAGRAYYQSQDPELLLEAFETWTHEGQFDELTRITALKGVRSQHTILTDPAHRREAIVEALSWCPVNVWIDIKEFYRAVKIWHFDFDVESGYYSNLYLGYREYGQLSGSSYWYVVKGLYINAIIWEVLASIGAVDLLYTAPEEANHIQLDDIYFDDDYLSLYDGLRYFRINNLGAYLLGQAGEYISAKPRDRALFSLTAERQLTIVEPEELTPFNQSQLELLTEPLGKDRYQLNTQKVLAHIEGGNSWSQLIDFLRSRNEGPLPFEVEVWLDKLQRNSQRFKKGGQALFIKVDSTELLEQALADPVLGKMCKHVGGKNLVISVRKETSFRKRLRELEYLLA